MSFTYDLTTDLGALRLMLGDTLNGSGVRPDGTNFTDAEMNYFLAQESSVGAAAALACETLANQYALLVSLSVGPRREELSTIQKHYADRSASLRMQYGQGLQFFQEWFAPPAQIVAPPSLGTGINPVDVGLHNTIYQRQGDTLNLTFTGYGSLIGRTKLYFTVKTNQTDADAVAQIQIEESAGLKYIAGASAGTPANGSLTVTDASGGSMTLLLAAVETAKLAAGLYFYDVKVIITNNTVTLNEGAFEVLGTVTAATS